MLANPELGILLDLTVLPHPPIFQLIQSAGVSPHEMCRTFNLGIGMLIAVERARADDALALLAAAGETAARVGEVRERQAGAARVEFQSR
jgi:phosphoribosylaminoimidazole (AIR) synthetase